MRFVKVAIASTTFKHPDHGGDETQEVVAAIDEQGNVWVHYLGGGGWRMLPAPEPLPGRPAPAPQPPAGKPKRIGPPGGRVPRANR